MRRFLDWLFDVLPLVPTILFIVFVGFLLYGACKGYEKGEAKWNDGKCMECAVGAYEYKQAVGHRTNTTYIYECNTCENRIEVYTLH